MRTWFALLARAQGFLRNALVATPGRLHRTRFAQMGRSFSCDPLGVCTCKTMPVGDNVGLGNRPILAVSRCKIVPGENGTPGSRVAICDDPSARMRAIILGSGRIGRAAMVAAGAVVTRSLAPCAGFGDNLAQLIGMRFDIAKIAGHERSIARKG